MCFSEHEEQEIQLNVKLIGELYIGINLIVLIFFVYTFKSCSTWILEWQGYLYQYKVQIRMD